MAPLLCERHRKERENSDQKRQRLNTEITGHTVTQTAGGDPRYRIPIIGLNPGAIPNTSPHLVLR